MVWRRVKQEAVEGPPSIPDLNRRSGRIPALPDYSLNGTDNQVAPGFVVQIFATGGGQTDPPGDAQSPAGITIVIGSAP